MCLDLRAPYSAELVQHPQQSRCEEVVAGPAVGPAPFRVAVCISDLSVDQKSPLARSLLWSSSTFPTLRNELEWPKLELVDSKLMPQSVHFPPSVPIHHCLPLSGQASCAAFWEIKDSTCVY